MNDQYCQAKYPVWVYWLQDQVTFRCNFQVYYYTEEPSHVPSDHDKWVSAGYSHLFLKKGDGLELSSPNKDEDVNAMLVDQFPEVFELVSEERD